MAVLDKTLEFFKLKVADIPFTYPTLSWFQYLEFWEACAHGDVETVLSCLSAGVSVDVTSRVS